MDFRLSSAAACDRYKNKNLITLSFVNVHKKFSMMQPLQSNFRSYSCSMKETYKICLRQTKHKLVSFCVKSGNSWKVSWETCKVKEIVFFFDEKRKNCKNLRFIN